MWKLFTRWNCYAGVGSLLGAWLSSQSSLRITLLGRSGRAANSALIQRLYLSPSAVVLQRCDVSCREEAATVFAYNSRHLDEEDHMSCGVVHAGGVLADGAITSQTAEGVRAVFAPKVKTHSVHTQAPKSDLG